MHITINDILNEQAQADEKIRSLTELLRNEAGEFLSQFKKSLYADEDCWSDGTGSYPFARMENINSQGYRQYQPSKELKLDVGNSVSFILQTVVNTKVERGIWVDVNIKMYKSFRSVIVEVDGNRHRIEIPLNSGENSYFDACKAVKEVVIDKIRSTAAE